MNQQIAVEVKDLTKKYGSKIAVDAVSFTVKRGEILGILGPNGAGKTSTLEMIETLRSIDSGQALIYGIDVAKDPAKIRRIIGVQTQASAFYDKVNLKELLQLLSAIYGTQIDAGQLLADVGLSDKAGSYPEKLSGGQAQRFSIAAALVNSPKVLFLDEPTTGLDPQSRRNMWELIEQIRDRGITIILTSHYMEEAQLLCDRVAIMDDGRVIALDTPKALIADLVKQGYNKQVKKVGTESANLEDVFISLTGKAIRD